MKFNIKIPITLRKHFDKEITLYEDAFEKGTLQEAWWHLERAHILGQAYPWQHSYVHYKMLSFGIHIKSKKEVIGQIPRLLVGGVKSFVGTIPVGNTGGANVPPLKPMQISPDLQALLNQKS